MANSNPARVAPTGGDVIDAWRQVVRDLVLLLMIVAILLRPALLGDLVKEVDLPGGAKLVLNSFDATSKHAMDVADVKTAFDDLLVQVAALAQAPGAAPEMRDTVTALTKAADEVSTKIDAAEATATGLLAQQQDDAARSNAAQPSQQGWIRLGYTRDQGKRWDGQPNVAAATPQNLDGQVLRATVSLYLRQQDQPAGVSASESPTRRKIIGVVKTGQSVQVVATRPEPAAGQRSALWAEVVRQ